MKGSGIIGGVVALVAAVLAIGGWRAIVERENRRQTDARTQVERWAETLDGRTNDTGIYDRHPDLRLPESDPWGHPLEVAYTQGGFAEVLKVRSIGKDGVPFSKDDIVAVRHSVNLKGVGAGLMNHTGEAFTKATGGAMRGIKEGLTPGFLKRGYGRDDDE